MQKEANSSRLHQLSGVRGLFSQLHLGLTPTPPGVLHGPHKDNHDSRDHRGTYNDHPKMHTPRLATTTSKNIEMILEKYASGFIFF